MAYYNYENSKKEKDLAGFEELSFQTHSYRPEYASYSDARRPERTRKLDRRIRAREIIEILRGNAASLCGGHDRQGRPIISILASKNDELNSEKLSETLLYLTQIPSNEVQGRGFTIIIDLRGSKWKSAKPMLRTLHDSIPNKIHQVIIIKPDAFWEKRKSDAGIKKEQSNLGYETIILSSTSKLSQFADDTQLPEELGGTLPYNHDDWLQRRTAIESYMEEVSSTLNELDNFQQNMESAASGDTISEKESLISAHKTKRRILNGITQPVIKRGRDLVRWIESYEPQIPAQGMRHSGDSVPMETEEKIQLKETLEELIRRDDEVFRSWENRMSDLLQSRDLKDFESGFQKVVDWIMGTGESYLSSSNKIGDSVQSCEYSKRAHEDFEFAAREIINLFGQVRDLSKRMLHGNHYAAREIQIQKDYLDKVCRSFASRMSRRRDLVIGALKFHQNAVHLSGLLDDLLELLCSDAIMKDDLESAETMLSTLEHKAEAVKQSYEETMREGQIVTEVLREPTTTAQGEPITMDCDEAIHYIQTTLDDLTERKQRTDELCDVRKLKLQQLLQLRTCERDAEQAIAWLQQLYSGAVDTSIDVGQTSEETLHFQQEHDKVEGTAKGTYDYGKQLLQASLVLRRTCRYELTPNQEMEEKLEEVWVDFSSAMAERGARLSVALMFYRSAEMVCTLLP